ncbi:MAG TPA: S8 family serine peptidase, partial [Polyangiaceae bacterium]|nr:S8 family serine peptidase [Polyangiaceae bacterium]
SGGGLVEHHSAGVTLDGRRSVGFPATAAGVIAVGSSVSRVSWRATDGVKREAYDVVTEDPLELGQLSSFSSRGPTRDPERTGTKPDCVAPGEMVVSALPAALLADTPPEVVVAERPAYYAIGAGTSQASPAAAGVIALLLERDPSLDPDAVRGLLRATSRLPEGVAPDGPDWGVGLLDARAALLSTPEIHPGEAPSAAPVDDGCGCAVAGRSGAVDPPWLLALLAGLGARCGRRAGRARRGLPPG